MNFDKRIFFFVLICALFLFGPTIYAENEEISILIVYSTEDDLPNKDILLLDATFSAFATEQTLISTADFTAEQIEGRHVVVYVGEVEKTLPLELIESIDAFKGKLIFLGLNVDQFNVLNDWQIIGDAEVRAIENHSLATPLYTTHILPPNESETLATGKSIDKNIPFIIKKGRISYIASTNFGVEENAILSKSIYALLEQDPPSNHPAYIRLEDISPISDYKLVEETGMYLADRGIPFYMAIIPVYVNNETGEHIRLSSNKKLVDVLLKLQDRGGIVIAHGYTHSYRYEETGEGFEFWDSKLNQQITTERTDEIPPPIRQRESFLNDASFEKYTKEMKQIERNYVEQKLQKSIEDLYEIGLYPLAFEAPHYTMSSNGYEVASQSFSAIFGQIQLSDTDWEVMDAPLFIGKPSILNGMTLFPETIGYVDPLSSVNPLQDMEQSINRLKTVPGSIIGGFYHPYLGIEYLPQMLELIESTGDIEWIDLRNTEQFAKTKYVTIHQTVKDGLTVSSTKSKWDDVLTQFAERPFEAALWIMSFVVMAFIMAFFIHIATLRMRLKKRLFRERESIG